jgi:hypothetical protein
MMSCRGFCQIFLPIFFAFLVGCGSVGQGERPRAILLESRDEACQCVAILPVSCLRVSVAPVPLFVEKDIRGIALRESAHGYLLAVTLTDHAACEMYRLLADADALGRKILLEYDGKPIGFSVVDDAADPHELIFVPEISSEACRNLFYNEKR